MADLKQPPQIRKLAAYHQHNDDEDPKDDPEDDPTEKLLPYNLRNFLTIII